MKHRLISLKENLFQIVILGERLLVQAYAILSELREIKELLLIQNEQGGDVKLFTDDEAAKKMKVSLRLMAEWEKAGKLVPVHLQGKRYYRESDIE